MSELHRDELQATLAEFEGGFVLDLGGELDLHGAGRLREELAASERAGGSRLVVDLMDVSFIDSSALGLLVSASKRLRARGGRLTLVTDDPRTLRVLEVTGLDRIFEIRRTLAEAMQVVDVVHG